MRVMLLGVLCCAWIACGEPRVGTSKDIVAFAADPIRPALSLHGFKDFHVDQAKLGEILDNYHHIAGEQWLHSYSHVFGGDRTGTATLQDGRVLRWLVRPGGLALIKLSEGNTY